MKFTKQVTIAAFGIGASFQRVLSVGQDQIGQKNTNDDEPNTEEGGAGAGANGILGGAAAALHPTLEDHRRHLRHLAAAAGDAKGRSGAGAETDSDDQDASAASAAAAAFLKKRQAGGSKEELRRRLQRLRTTGKDVRQTTEKYRQLQECDPSSSSEDENEPTADVGILSATSSDSCGADQTCRPSEDSPLGGYCIDDIIAEELVLPKEDDDAGSDKGADAAALTARRLVAPGCTCSGVCCTAQNSTGTSNTCLSSPLPTGGCDYANADGTLNSTGNSLVCTGRAAGRSATISNCDTVSFADTDAGAFATLSNIGRATFTGRSAGIRASISDVEDVTCDSNGESSTCREADITIPVDGSVTCTGSPDVALSYQACEGATFTFAGCGTLSCSNGACELYCYYGDCDDYTPYGDIQAQSGSSFSCQGGFAVGCTDSTNDPVPLPDPAPASFTCTGFDNDSCTDTCTPPPAPTSSKSSRNPKQSKAASSKQPKVTKRPKSPK